jgi:hypothetical protein
VLLEELQEKLKDMFLELEICAEKVELQCNEEKTAYMIVKRRVPPITTLNIDKYSFNKVEEFKYIKTTVTEHNKIAKKK